MAATVPSTTDFDPDADTPHRSLNNFALAHLERWVPRSALFKCRPGARRLRGGGDLAAVVDRAPDKVRKLNLKIVPAGIRDFGDGGVGNGRGYTPLDLVMAAHDCDLDTAFKFLSDHTGWAGERIVIEAPGPEPDAAEPAEPEPAIR